MAPELAQAHRAELSPGHRFVQMPNNGVLFTLGKTRFACRSGIETNGYPQSVVHTHGVASVDMGGTHQVVWHRDEGHPFWSAGARMHPIGNCKAGTSIPVRASPITPTTCRSISRRTILIAAFFLPLLRHEQPMPQKGHPSPLCTSRITAFQAMSCANPPPNLASVPIYRPTALALASAVQASVCFDRP